MPSILLTIREAIGSKGALRAILLVAILSLLGGGSSYAQDIEDYWAQKLVTEVEVANPVKRPVLGFGFGVTNFLGEIHYRNDNPILGSWAIRASVSTLLGRQKQIKANANVTYGFLEGYDRQKSLVMNTTNNPVLRNKTWYPNTAFQTEIIEISFTIEYNFWHLIGIQKTVRPYISAGLGLMIFTPKGNYMDALGDFYHFWPDGTIHMVPPDDPSANKSPKVRIDRDFETDLKSSNIFDQTSFPPVTAVLPFEVGVDFYLNDRVYLRAFTSLHYSFTDLLDGYNNVVAEKYDLPYDKTQDMFMLTGLAIHLDLFSQADSFILDKAFEVLDDFDYDVFWSDQDADGVADYKDQCPDTDPAATVDSVGCPIDIDGDGIPDYLDKDINTPFDEPVDINGVELNDAGMTLPEPAEAPVDRKKVRVLPVSVVWNRNYKFEKKRIPEKFLFVDIDGDGIISYDEVMRAVDDYFTGQNGFTPDDIYELNAYFFAQ